MKSKPPDDPAAYLARPGIWWSPIVKDLFTRPTDNMGAGHKSFAHLNKSHKLPYVKTGRQIAPVSNNDTVIFRADILYTSRKTAS